MHATTQALLVVGAIVGASLIVVAFIGIAVSWWRL